MDQIWIGILHLHGQRDSLRELRDSKKMADLQSQGFNVVGKSLLYYGEERTYNEAKEKCRHGVVEGAALKCPSATISEVLLALSY